MDINSDKANLIYFLINAILIIVGFITIGCIGIISSMWWIYFLFIR